MCFGSRNGSRDWLVFFKTFLCALYHLVPKQIPLYFHYMLLIVLFTNVSSCYTLSVAREFGCVMWLCLVTFRSSLYICISLYCLVSQCIQRYVLRLCWCLCCLCSLCMAFLMSNTSKDTFQMQRSVLSWTNQTLLV